MRLGSKHIAVALLGSIGIGLSLGTIRSRGADPASPVAKADSVDADARSAALLKALQNKVTFAFDRRPLSDVLADIRKTQHINIEVDGAALTDANITAEQPITLEIKGVSLRSALRLMLSPFELGFTTSDNLVYITTIRDTRRQTIETYQVDDLLRARDGFNQSTFDYDAMVNLITGTIASWTWGRAGGPANVSGYGAAWWSRKLPNFKRKWRG